MFSVDADSVQWYFESCVEVVFRKTQPCFCKYLFSGFKSGLNWMVRIVVCWSNGENRFSGQAV